MNKQNILLDFEDFLNSYIDKKQALSFENKFPLLMEDQLLEEYAYLIGKVMGDGNLDPVFTSRFIGKEQDLIQLRTLIINKFRINPKKLTIRRKEAKGISYLLQVNYAFFGRILYLLGAPVGNKTKKPFKVPSWILSNPIFKRRFLQALLEDELTTIKIEKCNYSVRPRLKLAKKEELIPNLREFMQQVKEAIESFGVECGHISKPVDNLKTKELYFFIRSRKKNIMKFKEQIGFRLNQNKIKKLDECYTVLKNSSNT